MDISIIDIGGNFLGPALGLQALGHEVRYFTNARGAGHDFFADAFGPRLLSPSFEADIVIYSSSASDEAWAEEVGIQREAPVDPSRPFFPTINPLQRRVREAWFEPRLAGVDNLVMVDMGDTGELLTPGFLDQGHFHFKRELPVYGFGSGVRPFPFLYNPALLALEWEGREEELCLPGEERGRRAGGLFAGTVGHWRYFGRRKHLLECFRRTHPGVPLKVIDGGLSMAQAWKEMQRHEFGLSLPGKGDLCFRHHELAFFGIPSVSAEEFKIRVPPEWGEHFPARLEDVKSSKEMLEFYMEHYHPTKAGLWILRLVQSPTPV